MGVIQDHYPEHVQFLVEVVVEVQVIPVQLREPLELVVAELEVIQEMELQEQPILEEAEVALEIMITLLAVVVDQES